MVNEDDDDDDDDEDDGGGGDGDDFGDDENDGDEYDDEDKASEALKGMTSSGLEGALAWDNWRYNWEATMRADA